MAKKYFKRFQVPIFGRLEENARAKLQALTLVATIFNNNNR